jgi:glycosyltransferase involved in cell wall biosynthesis
MCDPEMVPATVERMSRPTADAPERLRVLMICAHEPTMDPRIRWEAEGAARWFDVTVLGFANENRPRSDAPDADNYVTVRLGWREVNPLEYILHLRTIISTPVQVAIALTLFLSWPLLFVCEIGFRIVRQIGRLITVSLPFRLARSVLDGGGTRQAIFHRVEFVLQSMRGGFAPAASLFWDYLCNMPDKPHVVHCNDLDTLLVGVRAKREFGCRVVYDAHEFWPFADAQCRWVDQSFFYLLERVLIKRVDAVVSVNPMLSEAIRRTYRLDHVHSVPNVEPWVEQRERSIASPLAELAKGRVKFLFQGRFSPARGIDEIIMAWRYVDGTRAALFLRGPNNAWKEQATKLAAGLGLLNKSVFFLDAVSENDLVPAAAEADVGIIPYRPIAINERLSCPNKLSQYLHAGLMVITNDLPYVRSVVEQAEVGLSYNSADLQTFANVVKRAVNDPGLLAACRRNALQFARDDFNWQKHGTLFLKLYCEQFDKLVCGSPANMAVPPSVSPDMARKAGSHAA